MPFDARFAAAALTVALLPMAGCLREADAPLSAGTGNSDQAQQTELRRAADRAAMCSTREALAAGLRADYFADPGFRGAVLLSRQEGPLDQSWPAAAEGRVARSARWREWVKPALGGRYRFHSEEPGVRITVADQRFGAGADPQASIELATGRYVPITVEWPDRPADSTRLDPRLSWTAPHGARYLVPRAALYPPSDTVADARPVR